MARDARRWSGVAERVGSLVGMSMQGSTAATSPLMTPAEVARLAHVSKATIYREISRGELPVRHVGRQLRIDPDEFRAYLGRAER